MALNSAIAHPKISMRSPRFNLAIINFSQVLTMEIQSSQLPTDQLVKQILSSGELSRIDREQLKLALLNHSISEKELVLIEQVLDKVRKGLLNIVDES